MDVNADSFFGKPKSQKYQNQNAKPDSTIEFKFYKDSFVENPWEEIEKKMRIHSNAFPRKSRFQYSDKGNQPVNTSIFGNNTMQQQTTSIFSNTPNTPTFGIGNNTNMNMNSNLGMNQYSLNSDTSEMELSNKLDGFYHANNHESLDCMFTKPVYDLIPPNYNQNMFHQPGYIPSMNPSTWKEYQDKNPDSSKFFVNEVRGFKKLEDRFKANHDNAEALKKHVDESLKLIHDLTVKKDKILKENIIQNLKKNIVIMDKVISVHNLIEGAASKFNYIIKNPEKEMILFKAFNEIDSIRSQITTKTTEFKSKIVAQQRTKERALDPSKVQPSSFDKNFLGSEDLSGSKERFIEILRELKKSIHTFQNIAERNSKEMELMMKLSQQ